MKKRGFLYLRITVNPRGFHLILPMKFDESKDETQKHDDPKNAHYITSLSAQKVRINNFQLNPKPNREDKQKNYDDNDEYSAVILYFFYRPSRQ